MDRRQFLARRPTPAPLAEAFVATHAAREQRKPPPSEAPPYAGGLTPWVPTASAPWDARRAGHLLRRTGAGVSTAGLAALLPRGGAASAQYVVDQAIAAGEPDRPSWADLLPAPRGATAAEVQAFSSANSAGVAEANASVVTELLGLRHPGSPLRERLALLWHGVAPTHLAETGSRAHRLHEYWSVLRRNALGRYPTLISEVGLTQAMLLYLDGTQSRVGRPNENYAREVMELFTMGILDVSGSPNYSQQDVAELARAFTGWTVPTDQLKSAFVPSRFDAGTKTIFGVSGPFDYVSANALLFEQRGDQIAQFICETIYREFVHDAPNDQVVGEMAQLFKRMGYSVEAVLRPLLASAHFYSDGVLGSRIKSPLELTVGLIRETEDAEPGRDLSYALQRATDAGYRLFYPPNVSGWDGGRTWLDTSTLASRWSTTDSFFARRTISKDVGFAMPNPYDPYALVDSLAERMVSVPLSAGVRAEAVAILLSGIPDYEWDPTARSAPDRIRGLLRHLARLPEFQLT